MNSVVCSQSTMNKSWPNKPARSVSLLWHPICLPHWICGSLLSSLCAKWCFGVALWPGMTKTSTYNCALWASTAHVFAHKFQNTANTKLRKQWSSTTLHWFHLSCCSHL
jgi:hypothetical protein